MYRARARNPGNACTHAPPSDPRIYWQLNPLGRNALSLSPISPSLFLSSFRCRCVHHSGILAFVIERIASSRSVNQDDFPRTILIRPRSISGRIGLPATHAPASSRCTMQTSGAACTAPPEIAGSFIPGLLLRMCGWRLWGTTRILREALRPART